MQSIVWQSMSNASQATSHASQATSNASQAMSNASQATSNASQATSKHIFTRSRDPEILVFLQVCSQTYLRNTNSSSKGLTSDTT